MLAKTRNKIHPAQQLIPDHWKCCICYRAFCGNNSNNLMCIRIPLLQFILFYIFFLKNGFWFFKNVYIGICNALMFILCNETLFIYIMCCATSGYMPMHYSIDIYIHLVANCQRWDFIYVICYRKISNKYCKNIYMSREVIRLPAPEIANKSAKVLKQYVCQITIVLTKYEIIFFIKLKFLKIYPSLML